MPHDQSLPASNNKSKSNNNPKKQHKKIRGGREREKDKEKEKEGGEKSNKLNNDRPSTLTLIRESAADGAAL